jgi:hypothetical protein
MGLAMRARPITLAVWLIYGSYLRPEVSFNWQEMQRRR